VGLLRCRQNSIPTTPVWNFFEERQTNSPLTLFLGWIRFDPSALSHSIPPMQPLVSSARFEQEMREVRSNVQVPLLLSHAGAPCACTLSCAPNLHSDWVRGICCAAQGHDQIRRCKSTQNAILFCMCVLGARQAEGLEPRSHCAPLPASQSLYGKLFLFFSTSGHRVYTESFLIFPECPDACPDVCPGVTRNEHKALCESSRGPTWQTKRVFPEV